MRDLGIRLYRLAWITLGVCAVIFLLAGWAWAITYEYDELNRLKRVIYDNGASIIYEYDAAGNIVSVLSPDIFPPTIWEVIAKPHILWPPNNKMIPVTLKAFVTDNADPSPACHITEVSSNEPVSPSGDWKITGDMTLELRADRDGKRSGRTYTISVSCSDFSHNIAKTSTHVVVPHDQRDHKHFDYE
jgi:YD repeat-containing protein